MNIKAGIKFASLLLYNLCYFYDIGWHMNQVNIFFEWAV